MNKNLGKSVSISFAEVLYLEIDLKTSLFLTFSIIFVTGSHRKYLVTSKFNPAQREHSIEGCNFSVALVEVGFLQITLNRAYYATCATWRDLNLRANSKKIAFFQTTILGTTLEKLGH